MIEARSALYGMDVPVIDFLAGLGGRDVTKKDIVYMFDKLFEAAEGKNKHEIYWIGTRGVEI